MARGLRRPHRLSWRQSRLFPTTPEGYKFGAIATGLALLGGLITIAEQRRGVVNHALHIGLPETRRDHWAWPAQRTDGEKINPNAIPQGVTFRLPHDLDLDRIDWTPMRGCWRAWRRSTASSCATRLAPSSCMRKIHSRAEPAIRTLGSAASSGTRAVASLRNAIRTATIVSAAVHGIGSKQPGR